MEQQTETRPVSSKSLAIEDSEATARIQQERADMGDEEALIMQQREAEYNEYRATGGYYNY